MNEAFDGGFDAINLASRPIVTSASEHEDDGDDGGDSSTSSSSSQASPREFSPSDGPAAAADEDSDTDDGWSAADADEDGVRRQVHFPEDFLDEGADDEDEAYVYRNLRSGTLETVTVRQAAPPPRRKRRNGEPGDNHPPHDAATASASRIATRQLQVLKPRSTDAVLSCPRCFTIVTMDCQRHESYTNQFRAMFVMNIEVDWREIWAHSDLQQGLVRRPASDIQVVATTPNSSRNDVPEHYYTVNCSACHTQVAVLDMTEEVYHFTGCLASS